jgi:hypothetical protein
VERQAMNSRIPGRPRSPKPTGRNSVSGRSTARATPMGRRTARTAGIRCDRAHGASSEELKRWTGSRTA